MGISLVGMTVFLYPVMRKASKELAMGLVLFRGALEGVFYMFTTLTFLTLVAVGNTYVAAGSDSAVLQTIGNLLYQFANLTGPDQFLHFSHWSHDYIRHFLPHPVDPALDIRLGLYRRGCFSDCSFVEILSCGYRHRVLFGYRGDVPTGIGYGGLADREGIQSTCVGCPVRKSRIIQR